MLLPKGPEVICKDVQNITEDIIPSDILVDFLSLLSPLCRWKMGFSKKCCAQRCTAEAEFEWLRLQVPSS